MTHGKFRHDTRYLHDSIRITIVHSRSNVFDWPSKYKHTPYPRWMGSWFIIRWPVKINRTTDLYHDPMTCTMTP